MTTTTAQTSFSPVDQSVHVLPLTQQREQRVKVEPFIDNLDHLQALEQEAKFMLARALLRESGPRWMENPGYMRAISLTGFNTSEKKPEELEEFMAHQESMIRLRQKASEDSHVDLVFPRFCQENGLSEFDRAAVLTLFMLATSRTFNTIFSLCGFQEDYPQREKLKVGTLLTIICDNYRDQMDRRASFSIDAPLIKREICIIEGFVDDSSKILDKDVVLHDRYMRYILGDNNLYSSAFRYMRREWSNVRLDQVIMPTETKEEVVAHIGSYLDRREKGEGPTTLDDFYGYGTALTLLFYGPSGTGKTMLANALANHFKRQLFSFTTQDLNRIPGSYDELLSTIFREASLCGGIVLFDEADDLFQNDSAVGSSLLIEIEKARCVVILSTNKPVDLDPSMERRLVMKVEFTLPDAAMRLKMWKALMPDSLRVADDVDLPAIAERYLFTGGLIKNSIFLASNAASVVRGDGVPVITRTMIENAVRGQSVRISDPSDLCSSYIASQTIDELPLRQRQRAELRNAAQAFRRLQTEGLGLSILITTSYVNAGLLTAEALAFECGLKVRMFSLYTVLFRGEDQKILDPVSQRRVSLMEYAFLPGTGDASLTLFVDDSARLEKMLTQTDDNMEKGGLGGLSIQLRSHKGLFCMVTGPLRLVQRPAEFNLFFEIDHPSEETQLRRWEGVLEPGTFCDNEIVDLVEHFPMHLPEIDFISRQASIESIIKGLSTRPTLALVRALIPFYRKERSVPQLFGNSFGEGRRPVIKD